MFKFLAVLLMFALFGFLLVGVLLGRVIRFFGPTDKSQTKQRQRKNKNKYSSPDENTPQKKFAKNEGEYISYEEVKDEE